MEDGIKNSDYSLYAYILYVEDAYSDLVVGIIQKQERKKTDRRKVITSNQG
jgi:hypothetical protein